MKKKILIIILMLCTFVLTSCGDKKDGNVNNSMENTNEPILDGPKVQIVDTSSKTRPYAVMINNLNAARGVQTGLSDAYLVYEIIVEGGITRYLALYKDSDAVKLGSVRSARHYYLDYVLENDAIFVHWGYSDQAKNDISKLKINNINGLTYEGKYFYREKELNVSSEHTGFTTMEMLNNATKDLKYRSELKNDLLLEYSAQSIDLTEYNPTVATDITIKYSSSITNKYEYDAEAKVYKRFVNNKAQLDQADKEQLTVKNIIVYEVENKLISGDDKGRQNLDNIGTGSGYYITEGKAVKINWSKKSRESQTVYTYEDGKELKVNDGNTFIQIIPTSGKLTVN